MCLAKHLLVFHQIGSQYLDCQLIQNIFMNISLQSNICNEPKGVTEDVQGGLLRFRS